MLNMQQSLNFLSTIILLDHYRDSINFIERLIISISLDNVEFKYSVFVTFSKYYLLFPGTLERMILLDLFLDGLIINSDNLIQNMLENKKEILHISLIIFLCALTQFFIHSLIRKNDYGCIYMCYKKRSIKENYLKMKNYKIYCFIDNTKRPRNLKNILILRSMYHLKYCFFCNCLIEFSMAGCKLSNVIRKFKKNVKYCANYLRNRKILVNLSRKTFHLFVFFIFAYPTPLRIQMAEIFFVCLIVTFDSTFFRMIFKDFLSKNDKGEVITSHVYLLSAVIFPYYHLNRDDYMLNMISICVFDSMCSLVGTFIKKKTKSIEGSVFGLVFTVAFSLLFTNHTDFVYFILIAIIERITLINDNILLPFFTVIYFSFKSK